jgi:hypothetical protein
VTLQGQHWMQRGNRWGVLPAVEITSCHLFHCSLRGAVSLMAEQLLVSVFCFCCALLSSCAFHCALPKLCLPSRRAHVFPHNLYHSLLCSCCCRLSSLSAASDLQPSVVRTTAAAAAAAAPAAPADARDPVQLLQEAENIRGLLLRNREELGGLLRALDGAWVPPEAGGDLLRDGPGVLPTGAATFNICCISNLC